MLNRLFTVVASGEPSMHRRTFLSTPAALAARIEETNPAFLQ